MKKLFSLLLALTLVLSLVVVPARAADEFTVSGFDVTLPQDATTTIESGTSVIVNAKASDITVTEGSTPILDATPKYEWSVNGKVESSITGAKFEKELTTLKATDTITVSCKVTYTKDSKTGSASASKIFTVNNSTVRANDAFAAALSGSITYAGRTYRPDADKKITAYKFTDDASGATWTVPSTLDGYDTITITTNPRQNDGSLTITGMTTDSKKTSVTATFTCKFEAATVSVASNPTDKEVIAGGTLTLTATCAAAPSDAKYLWYVDSATAPASNKTSSFTLPSNTAVGTHSVKCVVMASDGVTKIAETTVDNIKVITDTYTFTVVPASVTLTQIGQTTPLAATFVNTSTSPAPPVIPTYSFVPANANIATVADPATATPIVTLRASGSTYVTATATYKGKAYVKTITVTGALLEATLSAVQNGATVNYSYSDLVTAAQTAINKNYYSSAYNYETVTALSGVTQVLPTTYGIGTSNATYTAPNGSGYLTFTANSANIGTAKFTANVSTRTAAGVNKSYSITFNVPVKPITTTYADQYPEPVAAYGNIYRYYVQVPADARYYYVAGVNNEPSDWNNGSGNKYYTTTTTSSTSLYSLTDSNFTNGKCTLYVVTQGTDYKLYCGTITVYQKNYNINYNGVAGETVQFKHTDFTNFMNEVAQARGDSSKTGSYPYVTFSYVTFDYPSTAQQGTLYYNGTAMSTSSYSGAFNSRTQITNLDNITFVPYAKTNAKTVAVTFTLHAVKYGTNGTVVNRDVQYRGTVNISLVREDVTFTVAPGDSVTFTDSAFLNYLRAQSGINYNYNIDYVTFDQSAVDTINGGVLYSGYAGFNAVKPTDRFYYTTTNNYTQNALSDVTFRASTYAKTGTTVYIPFTIYARYGTTGVGTRQVTGTVAVKIAQTMNFVDVKPTDYFYNPVKWAVGKNITKGTSAVTFSPDRTCTRAEIVTFLWRDAGSPMPTISRSPFSDVNYSMGADFYNAILWASQNGITAGTDVSHFSPNKTCTRAEIVTFLWRYAKKPVGYGNNSFTDVNKTDHAPYYDAILWAVSKGITNGSTTTTFAPDGTCTRGQAVTFLYRYEGGK